MKLKSSYQWFIRIGLLLIALAGLIFAGGDALIPQEGTMLNAAEEPEAFAELVTTDNFEIWAFRGLIGVPLEVIGTVALFMGLIGTAREQLAFWGMLLCVIGDVFGVAIFIFAYFVFPQVGQLIMDGMEAAASVAAAETLMPVLGLGLIMTLIGLILFAVAIWHASDRFPKWSGILVVVGFLMLLIQTSYVIQILANLTWGSAYLWMAVYSWNRLPFQTASQS